MPSDSLIEAADRYLAGKRCVLWQSFTIDDPEDRKAAAVWLAQQIENVLIEKARPGLGWADVGLVGKNR